jgi:uncharacterized radical SAM superfamily Fe-S cluster-containing enzyme
MPKEVFGRDYQFLEREKLLTFEETARLARIFASLGVQKIRITGGEPLLRRELERLIARLACIPGLDLTLTTNGSLLAETPRSIRRMPRWSAHPVLPDAFSLVYPLHYSNGDGHLFARIDDLDAQMSFDGVRP